MAGWKTQKAKRFDTTRKLIGVGCIEDSGGNDLNGRFYRVAYGTGSDGPHEQDRELHEKFFLVFMEDGASAKYYVPNPPFDGQDGTL